MCFEPFLIIMGAILTATISVMDATFGWLAQGNGHIERPDHQIALHAVANGLVTVLFWLLDSNISNHGERLWDIDMASVNARLTIGNSGIAWVDAIFDWCVILLVDLASLAGVTYEEVNIWIFLVIWPLVTLTLIIWIAVLTMKCRKLKRELVDV